MCNVRRNCETFDVVNCATDCWFDVLGGGGYFEILSVHAIDVGHCTSSTGQTVLGSVNRGVFNGMVT